MSISYSNFYCDFIQRHTLFKAAYERSCRALNKQTNYEIDLFATNGKYPNKCFDHFTLGALDGSRGRPVH